MPRQSQARSTSSRPAQGPQVTWLANCASLMTGVDMVHLQYRGNGQALIDLLADKCRSVSIPCLPRSACACGVHGDALALAAGPSDRGEFVPGYESSGYFGRGAPAGTPAGIIGKLNQEVNAGLADPKLKIQIADLSGIILGGSASAIVMRRHAGGWLKPS